MSRNLCQTNCDHCGCDEVELCGPVAPITEAQADRYFAEFEGMLVADAECMVCGARYIAWVDETNRKRNSSFRFLSPEFFGAKAFVDLSYRSSFDDEPDAADVGLHDVRSHLRRLRYLVEFEREFGPKVGAR